MDSMSRDPENRPTLERQRTAYSKKVFERQRHLIRTVSVQPMVAHADAKAGTHPVEEERDSQCIPVEHEECGYRSEVENSEGDAISPVYFWRVSYTHRGGGHGSLLLFH